MFIETKLQSANDGERVQNPYTGGKLPIKPIKPREPKVPSTGVPNPYEPRRGVEVPENKLSERLKEIRDVSISIHNNRSKIVSFKFVNRSGSA